MPPKRVSASTYLVRGQAFRGAAKRDPVGRSRPLRHSLVTSATVVKRVPG